jgi:hypothetical protein
VIEALEGALAVIDIREEKRPHKPGKEPAG